MSQANQLVQRFYEAFARRDGATMASCYSDKVVFTDPVFPYLQGEEAKAMWMMLCARAKDLKIEFRLEERDSDTVIVHWDARYTFGKTGRQVHNQITGRLWVSDGKIDRHVDDFSFWRWSRQAMGPVGWILGWTPWLKAAVRKEAARGLTQFLDKK